MKNNCKNCGKEFEFEFQHVPFHGGGLYCSVKCRNRFYKDKIKNCKTCGIEFKGYKKNCQKCDEEYIRTKSRNFKILIKARKILIKRHQAEFDRIINKLNEIYKG